MFPPMIDALHMAEHKRIFNRHAAYFGSYGWSGGARRDFNELVDALRWETNDDMIWEFKGGAPPTLLQEGEEFGYRFAESLKE
jgi:flavorubredoxin